MTVKELIIELKKYDEDLDLKILIKKYSSSQEKIVDESFEDIRNIIQTHNLDGDEEDTLQLEIMLYED